MKKQTLIKEIEDNKIIAILRNIPQDKLLPTAQALYNGGIRLLEVTFSADGKKDGETANAIKTLAKYFEGKLLIGAGTVLTKKQVSLTHKAGGKFIISPDTKPSVIKKTNRLGLVSIPGGLTPTEAALANKAGADFVKLFPISSMGASYVKAVKAPLSNVRFLAVGGINCDNMADYLKAGVCGFGIGTNIADTSLIEKGDFEAITALAQSYVKAVKNG